MALRRGVALLALTLLSRAADPAAPFQRQPNNTLRFPQVPASFGYEFVEAFPGVTFNSPMAIAAPPGETNRLFVVERSGIIALITNLASATPTRTVFLDIRSRIDTERDNGLQAMAFHPGFATNGYFYVFYTGLDSTETPGGTNKVHDILARFSVPTAATNTASAATEQKLIRQYDRQGDHNGADLHFGNDGYLYVSLGDEGSPNAVGYDYYTNSQCIDKNFFSGIIRIDVDRRPGNLEPNPHPAVVTNTYLVPADNPFLGATQFNGLPVITNQVRTEFWAVGLRNPFRFSFDRISGELYVGDVGQTSYEEINIVQRGGNYGWIFREGAHPTPNITRPLPAGFTNFIDPVYEYAWGSGSTEGRCVIGGVVYRGNRLTQLYGHYVFGDYSSGKVWSFRYDGVSARDFQAIADLEKVVAFGTDPRNGDVLAVSLEDDTIYRLIYDTGEITGTPLPATLAATGAFTNLATLTPHPGIVPYDVNVSSWSDGALKKRWFSVPNTNFTLTFNATNNWQFPTGTIWIKHFELPITNGDTASARRLETRFLVRNRQGIYGATYRWGTSTTNATLVPEEGLDETFIIRDASGGIVRTQTWRYPARTECRLCHTAAGGLALGFNTAQLNRDFQYGTAMTNQILALSQAGYFSAPVTNTMSLLALAAPSNTSVSVEFRSRSYLAANCAGCHQPGGVPEQQAMWDARIFIPLPSAGLVNALPVNSLANTNNRVIQFGSLSNSVLYYRLANLGPYHMPPLINRLVDTEGAALLAIWITNPPPVQFGNTISQTNGSVQLTVSGGFGWSNIIEAASDLTTPVWEPILTNLFESSGTATFMDTNAATSPVRFYRAVTP